MFTHVNYKSNSLLLSYNSDKPNFNFPVLKIRLSCVTSSSSALKIGLYCVTTPLLKVLKLVKIKVFGQVRVKRSCVMGQFVSALVISTDQLGPSLN